MKRAAGRRDRPSDQYGADSRAVLNDARQPFRRGWDSKISRVISVADKGQGSMVKRCRARPKIRFGKGGEPLLANEIKRIGVRPPRI